MQNAKIRKITEGKVRVIPLGGLGEVGKNMTVYEYGSDMIVVDLGSIFPAEDMPGVDLVIPDITYIEKNRAKLRGYFITHGHEDHIGASPYVLRQVPAPVYGTRLTNALIDQKLKEHRISGISLNVVKPGQTIEAGSFSVEFIHVNHSIADACSLAIHTPAGTIVHTGDFKVDYTPVSGDTFDFGRFAMLGREGVLALLCDSTNAEREGHTISEKVVAETLDGLFDEADGRVIVAMFSSNIHRIQSVINTSMKYRRRVCMIGRSMVNVTQMAMELGELFIPPSKLITQEQLGDYSDDEITVITTGSQGEPMSGLSRMAFAEHRRLAIRQTDTVIISSTPIPGNEKSVSRVLNQLMMTGANVIYHSLAEVHASGHACRDELKLMHALVKPKYFIPVHGEYRHLYQHIELARSMRMPDENMMIASNGDVIEMGADGIRSVGAVQSGNVLIDGLGIGDVGSVVLRDRKHLAEDGLLLVVIGVDRTLGAVVSGPDIISRGFVHVRESDEIIEGAKSAAARAIDAFGPIDPSDWNQLTSDIRAAVQRYIFDTLKRNPMTLTIIVET